MTPRVSAVVPLSFATQQCLLQVGVGRFPAQPDAQQHRIEIFAAHPAAQFIVDPHLSADAGFGADVHPVAFLEVREQAIEVGDARTLGAEFLGAQIVREAVIPGIHQLFIGDIAAEEHAHAFGAELFDRLSRTAGRLRQVQGADIHIEEKFAAHAGAVQFQGAAVGAGLDLFRDVDAIDRAGLDRQRKAGEHEQQDKVSHGGTPG